MAERYTTSFRSPSAARTAEYDMGLRAYMLKVYNYMASGVLLTGLVSMLVASNDAISSLFFQLAPNGAVTATGLGWIAMLSPLAFIMVMSFGMNKLSSTALQGIFWAFAVCFGISLSTIFLQYTGASIARTFFITAASFGALSLYGYTTKKSLSGMGIFLMMGLFGLIIASVVNIFLASSALYWITSVIGVLIFAGLTAYDTQRIKEGYYQFAGNSELMAKGAIMGATTLYLDFVNLFMYLLQFLGNRE